MSFSNQGGGDTSRLLPKFQVNPKHIERFCKKAPASKKLCTPRLEIMKYSNREHFYLIILTSEQYHNITRAELVSFDSELRLTSIYVYDIQYLVHNYFVSRNAEKCARYHMDGAENVVFCLSLFAFGFLLYFLKLCRLFLV
jgi:hypothetical protein